jgi:putative addiction module killer protein
MAFAIAPKGPQPNTSLNLLGRPGVSFTCLCLTLLLTLVDSHMTVNYSYHMVEIRKTVTYDGWFEALRDRQAKARINARVLRLQHGNPGQHRVLTGGVVEMKIDYGPGYRVYFTQRGAELELLLIGGDKTTQQEDIKAALVLAQEV